MANPRKTLRAVLARPVRGNIDWHEIEALIKALGGDVSYGGGSSVRFFLRGIRSVYHSPHPQKEANKGVVKRLQQFLEDAGVTEDEL